MPIIQAQTAEASDFISASERDATPSNDEGRVAKLESDGRLSEVFIRRSFGGDGSDGALSISSGTTTVNLGGLAVKVLNYTSISITGTGKLAFSNPHASGTTIILRSIGDVTITSSATPAIDARGMGASAGGNPNGLLITTNTMAGANASGSSNGNGGARADFPQLYFTDAAYLYRRFINLLPGAGGGTGGTGSSTHGTGGSGGGALYIECGGALNFTAIINTSGMDGQAAGDNVSGRTGGGGGGGSAGMALILYNSLTANTGTITAAGGAGGPSGTGGGATGSIGGGGGGAGSVAAAGANASAGSGNSGSGGGGGAGSSGAPNAGGTAGASMGGVIALNYLFV